MSPRDEVHLEPVPPGEYLMDLMTERGVTQVAMARQTGRPVQVWSEIWRGKKRITAETALDIAAVFPEHDAMQWLVLQSAYDLAMAKLSRDRRSA